MAAVASSPGWDRRWHWLVVLLVSCLPFYIFEYFGANLQFYVSMYCTAVWGCFSSYPGFWPARGVWFGSLGAFPRSAHLRLKLKAMAIEKPEL